MVEKFLPTNDWIDPGRVIPAVIANKAAGTSSVVVVPQTTKDPSTADIVLTECFFFYNTELEGYGPPGSWCRRKHSRKNSPTSSG